MDSKVYDSSNGKLEKLSPHFEPLVIIEFKSETFGAAQEWLTAKLQATRSDNGAELIVKTNTFQHSKVSSLRFT